MRQIDHDPNEHHKYPNYGEKEWARKKHGRDATPADFRAFFLPILIVSVTLFLWREGWPF